MRTVEMAGSFLAGGGGQPSGNTIGNFAGWAICSIRRKSCVIVIVPLPCVASPNLPWFVSSFRTGTSQCRLAACQFLLWTAVRSHIVTAWRKMTVRLIISIWATFAMRLRLLVLFWASNYSPRSHCPHSRRPRPPRLRSHRRLISHRPRPPCWRTHRPRSHFRCHERTNLPQVRLRGSGWVGQGWVDRGWVGQGWAGQGWVGQDTGPHGILLVRFLVPPLEKILG